MHVVNAALNNARLHIRVIGLLMLCLDVVQKVALREIGGVTKMTHQLVTSVHPRVDGQVILAREPFPTEGTGEDRTNECVSQCRQRIA